MHVLYQHSYLGHGLMSASKSPHCLVAFTTPFDKGRDSPSAPTDEIANPCLNQGSERVLELDADLAGEATRITMVVGKDVGSCNQIVEMVMAKNM